MSCSCVEGKYPINIIQGDSYRNAYTFYDKDGEVITAEHIGAVYWNCVRLEYQQELEYNVEDSSWIFYLSSTETADFSYCKTTYDLTLYFTDEQVETEIYSSELKVLEKKNKPSADVYSGGELFDVNGITTNIYTGLIVTAGGGGTNNHAALINRNLPNQHPMGAITGLNEALADKQDTLIAGENIIIGEDGRTISAVGGSGGTTDHRELTNRDVANQHPMSAITGLEDEIFEIIQMKLTADYLYKMAIDINDVGTVVDITPHFSTFSSIIIPCKKGESFVLTGTGGSKPRLWAFTDEEYKLLSKSGSGAVAVNETINVSADGYFISNVNTNKDYALLHNKVFSKFDLKQNKGDFVEIYKRQSKTVNTISHQGYREVAPKGTKWAYIEAKKRGFTTVENDISYSGADGNGVRTLYMWHDSDFHVCGDIVDADHGYELYTDNSNYYWYDAVNDVVFDLDYTIASGVSVSTLTRVNGENVPSLSSPWKLIKNIDVGLYMGENYKGTKVMTFAEWVLLCKQLGIDMYIDRKINIESYVSELVGIVAQYNMLDHASWVINTSGTIGTAIRAIDPNARLLIVTRPSASEIENLRQFTSGRGIAYDLSENVINAEVAQEARDNGFQLESYYVSFSANLTEEDILYRIRQIVALGVTGLTLDKYFVGDAYRNWYEPIVLPQGEEIHVPIKGIDYWTPADVAEIKSYVDNTVAEEISDKADTTYVDDADTNLQSQIDDLQAEKMPLMDVDTTPTDGSTNLVESGGVYDAIDGVQQDVDTIEELISPQASSSNKLVSASEMGDAISAVEAKQLYATVSQGSFATKAQLLSATTYYNADGTVATPTRNDVAYVLADESHDGKSAKYVIADITQSGIVWGFVITFSDVSFSQAQMDAVNSGVTSAKVSTYDSHVANKSNPHEVTYQQLGGTNPSYTKSEADALLDDKQPTISDLAMIRSGAALGATALQSVPDTYRTAANQDVIDNGKVAVSQGVAQALKVMAVNSSGNVVPMEITDIIPNGDGVSY